MGQSENWYDFHNSFHSNDYSCENGFHLKEHRKKLKNAPSIALITSTLGNSARRSSKDRRGNLRRTKSDEGSSRDFTTKVYGDDLTSSLRGGRRGGSRRLDKHTTN